MEDYTDLYIKYLQGTSDKKEKDKVENILRTDVYEREIFYILKDNLTVDQEIGDDEDLPEPDVNDAWNNQLKFMLHKEEKNKLKKKRTLKLIVSIAAAASIAIFSILNISNNTFIFSENLVHIITQGGTDKFVMTDNSHVFLNKNTDISYPEKFRKNRVVNLNKGEAYFEVTKTGNPFLVKTSYSNIEVLGTHFHVRHDSKEENDIVSVTEGKVKVVMLNNKDRFVILNAGETATVSNSDINKHEKNEYHNLLAWKNKELLFSSTKMDRVIDDLEAYFGTDIKVSNHDILNCRFTGHFENPQLKFILEIIAVSMQLEVEKPNANTYILKGKGCR